MQLLQVSEGLQDEQVDSFFIEGRDLFAKRTAGLGERDFAQRLNSHPQRADGAGNQGVETLCRLPGQTYALAIHVDQLIHTSMFRQAKRIRAKGVCFNDVCPGMQVFLMYAADEVGLRDVQFVIAAVDENTLGIQQCTHGAIAQHSAFL